MKTGFLSRNRPQYATGLFYYILAHIQLHYVSRRALFSPHGKPVLRRSSSRARRALSFSPLPLYPSPRCPIIFFRYILPYYGLLQASKTTGFLLSLRRRLRAQRILPPPSFSSPLKCTHQLYIKTHLAVPARLRVCVPLSPIAMQNPLLSNFYRAQECAAKLCYIYSRMRG